MDNIAGVLLLVVIIAVIMFIQKGINSASNSFNRNVLFKNEHQEGQKLIHESLTFITSASVEEVQQKIHEHMAPTSEMPIIGSAIFEIKRTSRIVAYAYGNKLYPRFFVIAVTFKKTEELTQGVFQFVRWSNRSGMLLGMEEMKKVRQQVWDAFVSADPSVRVTGTPSETNRNIDDTFPEDDGIHEDGSLHSEAPVVNEQSMESGGWKCKCNNENDLGTSYCWHCGEQKTG